MIAMLCAVLPGMGVAKWTATCRTQRLLWIQAMEAVQALAGEVAVEVEVMQAEMTPVIAQSQADPGTWAQSQTWPQ